MPMGMRQTTSRKLRLANPRVQIPPLRKAQGNAEPERRSQERRECPARHHPLSLVTLPSPSQGEIKRGFRVRVNGVATGQGFPRCAEEMSEGQRGLTHQTPHHTPSFKSHRSQLKNLTTHHLRDNQTPPDYPASPCLHNNLTPSPTQPHACPAPTSHVSQHRCSPTARS